ncbi:MAG: fasciclin domain-containing protein [Chitinophagaceae bacterium]|jgi:uncharacterized surface protein with fasciclin (FAS1) repeats|nr:fasciclin domain-containing protein [Chitinophagaceae bacterium]
MKKKIVSVLTFVIFSLTSMAQESYPMVGGAAMYPTKNIVENAVNSKDHTTLVAAVKAAGLVDALQSEGPFTVFAPTNSAFELLPSGTVEFLLQPENKSQLQTVLKYHVVAGNWSAASVVEMIRKNNNKWMIETLQGGKLYASLDDNGQVWLWDENGGKAMVTIADVNQKNGVIHVIDHVLLPK